MARRTVLLAVLAVVLAACSPSDGAAGRSAVRVASFDFPESRLVAELYAAALESRGVPVTRTLGLGAREVVQPALQQGLVDVVPEYVGSALRFLGGDPAAGGDLRARLAAALEPTGVLVLALSPAQDQNGVVVSARTAAERGLRTVSDLRPVAGGLRLGGPAECPVRPLCLPGLQSRYGLAFRAFLPMPSREVTASALATGEIDVGVVETTDGHLATGELVLLVDDRGLQPPENVVPVVRRAVVEEHGAALPDVLDEVSAALTSAGLAELNAQAVLRGEDPATVAGRWVSDHLSR